MDIYQILLEASEKRRRQQRAELLKSVGVEDLFEEGSIKIDMRTCKGVECKLCIEICPTHALYWKDGEVGITEELCIYCTSCVLNCMVDDCIVVERERSNGEKDRFSNPTDVFSLTERLNAENRRKIIDLVFPDAETYMKRYRRSMFQFGGKDKS